MVNQVSIFAKSIVFQLHDEYYALPITQVRVIEHMHQVTRVPGTPNYVKGVMNLHGVVIPVIDLRMRFGLSPKQAHDDTRIIIAYSDEMEAGLVVDQANDVVDIPDTVIESAPELIGASNIDFIDGVVRKDQRLLMLLNLSKVLSQEDLKVSGRVEK